MFKGDADIVQLLLDKGKARVNIKVNITVLLAKLSIFSFVVSLM